MTDNTTKPAWHFWLVAAAGLIWNAMGCANFLFQLSPEQVASYPENYQAFIATRPVWATTAFALTVFGGLIGCALLLFRRKSSNIFLALSLLGAIGAVASVLGLNDMSLNIGTGVSLAVAIGLLGYASKAHQMGLLRAL